MTREVNNISNEEKQAIADKLNAEAKAITTTAFNKLTALGVQLCGSADNPGSSEWSEACRKSSELEKKAELIVRDFTPVVGDGATLHWYTDANAFTIISVSKSGKSFKMQQDTATRLTKPEFITGGFAGHCVNNHGIQYSYEPNPQGTIRTVRMTKKGWKTNNQRVTHGRSEHYDYNF
jgi:hypothetical protein